MGSHEVSLKSDRLTLDPFVEADRHELLELFRDPAVRRYLLDDLRVSTDWISGEIASSHARFADSGAGLWSARLVHHPEIIGFAGFREFFDPPQLQLLYGLLPRYWGRGLATEAARAVCDHAFRDLAFAQVVAAIDIPNEASRRVLERLSMQLNRTALDGEGGSAFYVLDRAAWIHSGARR